MGFVFTNEQVFQAIEQTDSELFAALPHGGGNFGWHQPLYALLNRRCALEWRGGTLGDPSTMIDHLFSVDALRRSVVPFGGDRWRCDVCGTEKVLELGELITRLGAPDGTKSLNDLLQDVLSSASDMRCLTC